jgi:DNA-binding beta-propeller fold protein YncE
MACNENMPIHLNNTYNTGVNPANLAITSNGKYAYVANSNNYSIKDSDSVTVLDLRKGVPKVTIHDDSFVEPYRIAIDHCNKFAYVCNSGSPATTSDAGTVSIIDIKTNTVVGVIEGFDGPGGIVITKNIAYVTNYGAPGGVTSGHGTTVSVVDLITRKIIKTIVVSLAPAALALSPDDKFLYVIAYTDGKPGTGRLDVISTKTNTVLNSIPGFFGPFGIAVTKDGEFAYVTNFGSNDFAPYGTTVSVVDLDKIVIVKTIELGIQPSGIAISKDFAYVSNYNTLYAKANFQNLTPGEGTVNIICLKSNKVISPTISIGQSPSTVVLSPNQKKLYVCKYVQNTVAELVL